MSHFCVSPIGVGPSHFSAFVEKGMLPPILSNSAPVVSYLSLSTYLSLNHLMSIPDPVSFSCRSETSLEVYTNE